MYKSGIIFVHFPENGHHGCGKHCSFCLFDKLDYNIPVKPSDVEVLEFLDLIRPAGKVQICGAGDPLYNFDKNKDYVLHLVDLIHSTGRQVQIVTKYVEVVAKYADSCLSCVDMWLFSVEHKDALILNAIKAATNADKAVKITKIANFTPNIYAIDWQALDDYVSFYSQVDRKDRLTICFRPNFNFEYDDEDVEAAKLIARQLGEKYGCFTYMHSQSRRITTPQLWNGRLVPCGETAKYVFEDMGLEFKGFGNYGF